MADLATVVRNLQADCTFTVITRNPLAQFATQTRLYIGAELLPEREVMVNLVRDLVTKYLRTIASTVA